MIRVFDAGARDFTTLGKGVIEPQKAVIHEEDNGDYYLDLTCGLDCVDLIKHDDIIVAPTPDPDHPYEPFRIGNIRINRKKIVARCPHVTDDLKGYMSCPPNTDYAVWQTDPLTNSVINNITSPQAYLDHLGLLYYGHPDLIVYDTNGNLTTLSVAGANVDRPLFPVYTVLTPDDGIRLTCGINCPPPVREDDIGETIIYNDFAYTLFTNVLSFYDAVLLLMQMINEELYTGQEGCHLVRHGFSAEIVSPQDFIRQADVTIHYGVNLKDIEAEYNYDDSTTQIYFRHGEDYYGDIIDGYCSRPRTSWLETSVFNGQAASYKRPYMKVVDLDYSSVVKHEKFQPTDDSAAAQIVAENRYRTSLMLEMNKQAFKYVGNNYKELSRLGTVSYDIKAHLDGIRGIGDRVKVWDEYLGVKDLTTIVRGYDYDCLLGRFNNVLLDNAQKSLKAKIVKMLKRG